MSTAKMKRLGVKQMKEATLDLNAKKVKLENNNYSIDELSYDVPVSGTVYGAALNYKGAYDALEPAMNEDPYKAPPKAPILYIKPVNTFTSAGTSIPLPDDASELSMGAALGVVIGKTATKVDKEKVLDYVSGYTIVNDVSIPHESVYRPALKEKARDGFCPIGPWIVDRDSIEDPNALQVRVLINGVVKQENTTANLVRSVEQLLADVTDFMTLFEGDVLLVGIPENAPLAGNDDFVQIEIEGIGTLENKVTEEKVVAGGVK